MNWPTKGALACGETFSYSYNKQNQLTVAPHSGTTPVIGMVQPVS